MLSLNKIRTVTYKSNLAHLFRGPVWCQSICSWNVMQKKRCTAPTLRSTAPACLRAATIAASSSNQTPPGPHQNVDAAPLRPPATSPSSLTRLRQPHQKATSKRLVQAAHLLALLPQEATRCPHSLPVIPPHTPCPGLTPHIPRARLFQWPCLHHPYLPLIITHTCTWALPPVRNKELQEGK